MQQPSNSKKGVFYPYLKGNAGCLYHWYGQLQGQDKTNGQQGYLYYGLTSGDKALLRRCQTLEDVALQPAFIYLWKQVEVYQKQSDEGESKQVSTPFIPWLMIAWVLSQIKQSDILSDPNIADHQAWCKGDSLGKLMGGKSNDRIVSALRFEKLITTKKPEEFALLIIRTVKLLNQKGLKINVLKLADDLLHWFYDTNLNNQTSPKNKLIVQWALDYYHV